MSAVEASEIALGEATRAALSESTGWITVATQRMGELSVDYIAAREQVEHLEMLMRKQAAIVRESEAQHAKIIGILVDSLNLPAGDWHWVYDAKRGAFVKKEISHV